MVGVFPRCMEAGYKLNELHDKRTCPECGSQESDMAKPGYASGMKCGRPPAGKNGPNDKGGGTKTFKPPMPKPNAPRQGGSGK